MTFLHITFYGCYFASSLLLVVTWREGVIFCAMALGSGAGAHCIIGIWQGRKNLRVYDIQAFEW